MYSIVTLYYVEEISNMSSVLVLEKENEGGNQTRKDKSSNVFVF